MTEGPIAADTTVTGVGLTDDGTTIAVEPGDPTSRAMSQSDIAELISKDYVGLRLLITRRTGDPQVAADLLNDAVCLAWEKWQAGQIQRPELIAGFVFKVAINL